MLNMFLLPGLSAIILIFSSCFHELILEIKGSCINRKRGTYSQGQAEQRKIGPREKRSPVLAASPLALSRSSSQGGCSLTRAGSGRAFPMELLGGHMRECM